MFFEKILSLQKRQSSKQSSELPIQQQQLRDKEKQVSQTPITMTFGHEDFKAKSSSLKQKIPLETIQSEYQNIQPQTIYPYGRKVTDTQEIEDLYSTPTLKYDEQCKKYEKAFNQMRVIDISSESSKVIKHSDPVDKGSVRSSQNSNYSTYKVNSPVNQQNGSQRFLNIRNSQKSQNAPSRIHIELQSPEPIPIKTIPLPKEEEQQDYFNIKQTQQAIEQKLKQLNNLRNGFRSSRNQESESNPLLERQRSSVIEDKKITSYVSKKSQTQSEDIKGPFVNAQNQEKSVSDPNDIQNDYFGTFKKSQIENRSYVSEKKSTPSVIKREKQIIQKDEPVNLVMQKNMSQASNHSMPLSTNSLFNKKPNEKVPEQNLRQKVLELSPVKQKQSLKSSLSPINTVKNQSSKASIQEMVKKLKAQLKDSEQQFRLEPNNYSSNNAVSQRSPFNDGFVDYEANEISQIRSKNSQNKMEGSKIVGNLNLEHENSLIESLNEQKIGHSEKKNPDKNGKTVAFKETIYGLKQKQRENSNLEMTPSFNRQGLYDFESKPNALVRESNRSKNESTHNIILGLQRQETAQKRQQFRVQKKKSSEFRNENNSSSVSTPQHTVVSKGPSVVRSITDIIARQSPASYNYADFRATKQDNGKAHSVKKNETHQNSLKVQQQLLLKQHMIKNLSLQLYNERQKAQKLEGELKILSVQKLNFEVSRKLEESLSDWIMNSSGVEGGKFEASNTGIGQIVHEFKNLKKEMFTYQEYIFDLEQENVRLKEMREHEFNQLRDSLKRQYKEEAQEQIRCELEEELMRRVREQRGKYEEEVSLVKMKLEQDYKQRLEKQERNIQTVYKSQSQQQVQKAKEQLQEEKRSKQKLQQQFEQKQLRQSQKNQSKLNQTESKLNQTQSKLNSLQQQQQQLIQKQSHKQQQLVFSLEQAQRQVIELRKEVYQSKAFIDQLQIKVFRLEQQIYSQQYDQFNREQNAHRMHYSIQTGANTKSSRDIPNKLPSNHPNHNKNIHTYLNNSLSPSKQENSIIHTLDPLKTDPEIPFQTHQIQTYFLQLKDELTQRESAIIQTESNLVEREKQLILREEHIYKLQLKLDSDLRKIQMKQQSLQLEEQSILQKYQEIKTKQILFTHEKLGFKNIQKPSEYGLTKTHHTDRPTEKPSIQISQAHQLLFQPPQKDTQTYHSAKTKSFYDRPHCPTSESSNKIYDQPRYNPLLNASRSERSRSNSMEAQKILSKMKAEGSINKRCKCNNEVNMCVCQRPQRSNSHTRQMVISANRPARISPPKRPTVQQAHKQLIKETIQSSYYGNSTPTKLNSPRVASKKDTPIHTLQKIDKYEEGQKSMKLKIIEDKVKRIKSEAGLGHKIK